MIKKKQYKISDKGVARYQKETLLNDIIEVMPKQIAGMLRNQLVSLKEGATTKEKIMEIISEQVEIACYNVALRVGELKKIS